MATTLSPTDPYWLSEANNGPGSIYDSTSTYTGTGTDPAYLPGGQYYNAVSQYVPDTSISSPTTATPTIDPQTAALYDQQIANVQNSINRLGGQQDVGNQNINTAYNSAFNTLTQQKLNNQTSYNQGKTQNTQDYRTAKNTIGTNAGNTLNSLLRLLGSRGAAGGSAALQGSQAVGTLAGQQRAGAGQNYAQNAQGLDTNWNNYLTGEQASEKDLLRQQNDSQNTLAQQIATTRANLLGSLATLTGQKAAVTGGNAVTAAQPYIDQSNQLLSQADQLGRQTPIYQVAPTTYSAPSLSSYITNPNAAPTVGNPSAATDAISPYLSLLLGGKKLNSTSAF